MKSLLSLALGAAVLAIAGCGGVVVNRSEIAGGYTGSLYTQSQAAGGTNAVTVRNAPFPPEAILNALRARFQGDQYRFGLGPPPAEWNGYTIVLGFGGAPVGIQNLCQNPDVPLRTTLAGRTDLIGDYCYGNILVTEATGWTGAVTGPDDPRFQHLVGDVVTELFAYKNRPGNHGSGSPTH